MSENKGLTRRVAFMLTPGDYQRLQVRFAKSSSPCFGAFCREVLLSRPVTVRYHNASADEFLIIALEIKSELEEVLLGLQVDGTPESRAALVSKVDELKLVMHQIYQQWASI